ncbi:MAG: RNase P subunit p30 family protein [Candidatus Woesearchaeota archaeon]
MIDLIGFEYTEKDKWGFSNFFSFKDFKIVIGGDDGKNRKAVENKNVDILMGLENKSERDFMHSRNSGLNQVLCNLAKKNGVGIGFCFRDVLKSKNRGLILGRMMQNVKLCRKYKVKMMVFSGAKDENELKSARDIMSFGIVLGMTAGEAKKALSLEKRKG